MGDQGLIAAVRLSDKGELEQPDPLILSGEEVKGITWRHFETLLKSMYLQPPEAIQVKYLDDESDWVELSSDVELFEALKYTRESGEILQLQVKVSDNGCLIRIGDEVPKQQRPTAPAPHPAPPQLPVYIPTTDPGDDVMVYPATETKNSHGDRGQNTNNPEPPLSYPQHSMQGPSVIPAVQLVPSIPMPEQTTPQKVQEGTPSEPAQLPRLVYPYPRGSTEAVASAALWDQAAYLSSEEKILFLKSLAKQSVQQGQSPEAADLVEPLCQPSCPQPTCLGTSSVPNQDPFEVPCSRDEPKPCAVILTPTQAGTPPSSRKSDSSKEPGSVDQAVASSSADVAPAVPVRPSAPTAAVNIPRGSYSSAVVPKAKLTKKVAEKGAPVPMPRNLLMMEGAQSGANAVAIEMPSESEYYGNNGVNKEEEIAASGGAASTAASEETGEIVARGGSHAASVDGQIKATSQASSCSEPAKNSTLTLKELAKQSRKSRPSNVKKESDPDNTTVTIVINKETPKKAVIQSQKSGENLGVGAKPKALEKKAPSSERKKTTETLKKVAETLKKTQSPEKKKPAENPSDDLEEDAQGAADSKAGKGHKKDEAALKLNEFVKHMNKMKKDIQCSIVKDVTKQTDKLLKKRLSRSVSLHEPKGTFCNVRQDPGPVIHKGITCDHCDLEIVGVRYKCGNCEDFDLCEQCESSEFVHDPTHIFLKLRKPARKAGCVGKTRVPLLRENVYEAESVWEEKKQDKERRKREEKEKEEEKKKAKKKVAKKKTKEEGEKRKIKKERLNEVLEDAQCLSDLKEPPTRSSPEMSHIMENMAERQASQERATPREWSPYEDVPLKMASPVELQELFDVMWVEKQKMNVADDAKLHLSQMRPKAPLIEDITASLPEEMEPFLPVNRERTHSNSSSGSSIVQLLPPEEKASLHDDEKLQAMLHHPADRERQMAQFKEAELLRQLDLPDVHGGGLVVRWAETEPQRAEPVMQKAEPEMQGAGLVVRWAETETQRVEPVMQKAEPEMQGAGLVVRWAETETQREEPVISTQPVLELAVPQEVVANSGDSPVIDPEPNQSSETFVEVDCSSDSSYACYESDSSEDFCVIDHPRMSEDYEEIDQSDDDEVEVEEVKEEKEEELTQREPLAVAAPREEEESLPLEREDENNNEEVREERSEVEVREERSEVEVREERSEVEVREERSEEADAGEQASLSEDLVHSMNAEEKARFQELLKAEMDRDFEEKKKQKCEAEIRQHQEMKQQLQNEMKMLERAEEEKQKAAAAAAEMKQLSAGQKKFLAKRKSKKRSAGATREDIEYREILEVKTMQAVLANNRLEEAALEEEARREMGEESEEWKRHREVDPPYYRLLVTDRRVGRVLELEVQKFEALDCGDRKRLQDIEHKLVQLDRQKMLDEKKVELAERDFQLRNGAMPSSTAASVGQASIGQSSSLSRQVSAASTQCDTASELSSDFGSEAGEKRDADCQTLPEPNSPASHIIQNVAFGMSKAASTAFSTAKDVFYSLQAKQNEWKAASAPKPPSWKPKPDDYIPPTSRWTPPEDTYVPPQDHYTPPADTYVPPKDEYVPPTSTWIPPPATFTPPTAAAAGRVDSSTAPQVNKAQGKATSTENQKTSSDQQQTAAPAPAPASSTRRSSSSPLTSPFSSLEIADSALRRELQGMQRLIEMGFANREQNRQLLNKFDGDLEKVVQALLQEEGEDHWAFSRH